MQNTTRIAKTLRTAVIGGALLAALAFGSVAASGNDMGLTECDHGCGIAILSGQDDGVAWPMDLDEVNRYVSNGPGEIGYTR